MHPKYCKANGEYVILYYPNTEIELDFDRVVDSNENYKFLKLKSFKKSIIVLHKKYIHELVASSDRLYNFGFEPTKSLTINVCNPYSKFKFEEFMKYISSPSLKKLHTALDFHISYDFNTNEGMTEAIFENLNIRKLSGYNTNFTPEVYDKIKNCHSLNYANLRIFNKGEDLLDAIEANSKVKQWSLYFGPGSFTDSVQKRLQAMILDRNDNSLQVYGYCKQ